MLSDLLFRFRSLFRRKTVEGELDDELHFHFEQQVEKYVKSGLTREEAIRRTRLAFGGADQIREECRDASGVRFLESFAQDIRYGMRMLRRSLGFTLAIVLTLALGVGVNVTMLNVVHMLLFRIPAHVRQPESVLRVDSVDKSGQPQMELGNYPGFRQLSENAKLLEVAASGFSAISLDYGRGTNAREIEGQFITHSYFDVLGTQLLIGRPFSAEEERQPGGAPVAILGFDFWKKQFGADPKILGQEIWIQGKPHAVIGVTPSGFTGLNRGNVDTWLPVSDEPSSPGLDLLTDKQSWWLQVIGRSAHGSTQDQAAAEATSAFQHSGGDPAHTIQLEPYLANFRKEVASSKETRVSLWLSGVAFLVFLIACANVTNLFLVRTLQRGHEMAVRLQLGATRSRLIRQFLAESLILSFMGGLAALLLSYWARPVVRAFLLPPKFYDGGFFNLNVLEVTVCFALLAGIVNGVWPAWRASRPDLTQALKSGRNALNDRSRVRSVLLVAQVALTLVLSVGAALFVRSLQNVRAIQVGFDAAHLLVARMSLLGYQPTEINAAYERMRERALAVPGVENAAIASMIPFQGYGLMTLQTAVTNSSPSRELGAGYNEVGLDYFATIGMRILQGRTFLPSDRTGSLQVAIINESLAKEVAPNGNALDQCLMTYGGKDCMQIVGVVPDEKREFLFDDVPGQPKGSIYTPLYQVEEKSESIPFANGLLVRTHGNPSAIERNVASALASASPGSRYVSIHPITEAIDRETLPWRMGANMFTLFGALALLLAAVGIYGLLAFLVRYRTAEIGVRLALGATPSNIMALVLRRGMLLVGIGIAIGTGTAIALSRLMRSLLYGISSTDLVSYVLATCAVAIVALLACYIPARRAMRIDPMVVLRYE